MFFQAVRFFFSGMSTVSLVPGDQNGERERLGDLQALANIGGPNVTIEDWMVGLEICGKECVKLIRTFALKSDSLTDRMAPLMLSRCMQDHFLGVSVRTGEQSPATFQSS